MATIINELGEEVEISPENGSNFNLKELQSAVGGLFEMIQLSGEKILVVNEEGLILGLPINLKATSLARRPILGPAILCEANQIN
jgi:hypothetical protein